MQTDGGLLGVRSKELVQRKQRSGLEYCIVHKTISFFRHRPTDPYYVNMSTPLSCFDTMFLFCLFVRHNSICNAL